VCCTVFPFFIFCSQKIRLWLCAVIRNVQAEDVGEESGLFSSKTQSYLDLTICALSYFQIFCWRSAIIILFERRKKIEENRSRCLGDLLRKDQRGFIVDFWVSFWNSEIQDFILQSSWIMIEFPIVLNLGSSNLNEDYLYFTKIVHFLLIFVCFLNRNFSLDFGRVSFRDVYVSICKNQGWRML